MTKSPKLGFEITFGHALIDALDEVLQRAVKAALVGQRQAAAAPVVAPPPPKPPEATPVRQQLTREQVLKIVPIGKSTMKRMIQNGTFPKASYISPNKLVWYADEIAAWQDVLPHSSSRRTKRRRPSRK